MQEQKKLIAVHSPHKYSEKKAVLFKVKTKQIQLYIFIKGHAALTYCLQKNVAVSPKPNPRHPFPFYPPNTLDAMHLLSLLNLLSKALLPL